MRKKIAFDIGHPAHVHYFKNLIYKLQKNNFDIYISARDKEITHDLLNELGLDFFNRGKGRKTLLGKIIYVIEADIKLFNFYKKIRPDIFISFGSAYMAHTSKLLRKKHIALDDTEHATFSQKLYVPFTDLIITPDFYKKVLSSNQIRCNCFFEQTYLDQKYFTPLSFQQTNKYLQLDKNQKFIFVRFVSWEAAHDRNQKKLSLEDKIKLIKKLSRYGKVLISSEGSLPPELQPYELSAPKKIIHSILYHADLFISESGTMTTEAALLGTPTILTIDEKFARQFGNFDKLLQENLIQVIFNIDKIIDQLPMFLEHKYKEYIKASSSQLKSNTIDINNFLYQLIQEELKGAFTNSNSCKK